MISVLKSALCIPIDEKLCFKKVTKKTFLSISWPFQSPNKLILVLYTVTLYSRKALAYYKTDL
jgi:hypothetical protein